MARYFIHLSYDGTNYHGWQIQPNGDTVEEQLEKALAILFRKPIDIVGAGRTDTGVHARHMAAHFDCEQDDIDCEQLVYRMNRIVPKDIAIYRCERVSDDLHARFSATLRTYHYYIHTRKEPFSRHYSCEMHFPIDFERMNIAASHLLNVSDFAAFCKSHTDVKTTLCTVTEARWIQDSPHCWHFRISANRFLRNMVRAVVGTLIEVGRGRMTIEEFDAVVAGKKRTAAGESMPGNALFLEEVKY